MENTKQIGDRIYSFGTIPPMDAIRVEVAIARVIGEPLFKAFMDAKKTGSSETDAEQAGATAVGMLLSKMDADELLKTMETVFKYVSCEGKRIDLNASFAGRLLEMHKVFVEALKFNFSDFLPAGLFASVQNAVTK